MSGVEVIVLGVAAGVAITAGSSYYLKRRRAKRLRLRIFKKDFSKFKSKRFDPETGVLKTLELWLKYIDSTGYLQQGVFRISARQKILKQLTQQANEGKKIKFEKFEDGAHVCAGLIKLFFREMPECLVSFSLYKEFMDIQKNENDDNIWIEKIQVPLNKLSQRNLKCLKRLLATLYHVHENAEKNLMHAKNLAVVFGPCLIFSPSPTEALTFLNDCSAINSLVERLILYSTKIRLDIKPEPTKKEKKKD